MGVIHVTDPARACNLLVMASAHAASLSVTLYLLLVTAHEYLLVRFHTVISSSSSTTH
jgi:hypothetical protein